MTDDHKPDARDASREEILKVMTDGALESAAWSTFYSNPDPEELMRAALSALEKEGYGVVHDRGECICKACGIRHGVGVRSGTHPF